MDGSYQDEETTATSNKSTNCGNRWESQDRLAATGKLVDAFGVEILLQTSIVKVM